MNNTYTRTQRVCYYTEKPPNASGEGGWGNSLDFFLVLNGKKTWPRVFVDSNVNRLRYIYIYICMGRPKQQFSHIKKKKKKCAYHCVEDRKS